MNIDIFNGDADGICALIQLRRAFPVDAQLVTGVKRDIDLLRKVAAKAGDKLTVLDISLDKNRHALLDLLNTPVDIFYADHHFSGEIPHHPRLTSLINTDASLCTSLLINQYLDGQFPGWAVTGAFGDNLTDSAHLAAKPLQLSHAQLEQLQQLGICINYNAYGATLDDLHIAPAVLYRQLVAYASPFDFIAEQNDVHQALRAAYADDMHKANTMKAEFQSEQIAVYLLPDEQWARRVNGVWGNELANQHPNRAHAVISYNQRNGYQVSVRAPINQKSGADTLCNRFPEGGGRKAAAGINHLEKQQLSVFIDAFRVQFE
ncbi:MAG: DHH family phosphoesterase [Methylococcales bacterium]|nr:DHH family phosphoesterase [Methylococcales bacterium]